MNVDYEYFEGLLPHQHSAEDGRGFRRVHYVNDEIEHEVLVGVVHVHYISQETPCPLTN